MVRYRREGEARAAALGNRGPIRFTADGAVDPAIIEAYDRTGFYIFEGVLSAEELEDIERDVIAMLDNAPVTKGAALDRHGRPALGADGRDRNLGWVKPLSDPVGGTSSGQRPAPGQDDRARRPRRGARLRPADRPRLAAVLPRLPAGLRPSRPAARGRGDQRRRLRAVQRGGVDQAGRPRRIGGVAPGRLDALGQPAARRPHPRVQLHGPALRLHVGQRAVGRARLAPDGQGRHQGDGRRGRLRPAPRRGADRVRTRRRGDHQPPVRARLVRQHQPGPAGDDQLRVPPPARRCSASRAAASTTPSPCTTRRASTSARRRSSGASTPAPSASRPRTASCTSRSPAARTTTATDMDTMEQLRDYNRNDLGI